MVWSVAYSSLLCCDASPTPPLKNDPWWQSSQIIPRLQPLEFGCKILPKNHFSEYLQASTEFVEKKKKDLHLSKPSVDEKESQALESAIAKQKQSSEKPPAANETQTQTETPAVADVPQSVGRG